jgi:hypothetical protein
VSFQQPNARGWVTFARRWAPNRLASQVVDPQPVVVVGHDASDGGAVDGVNQVLSVAAGQSGAAGLVAIADFYVTALQVEQRTALAQMFSIATRRGAPPFSTSPMAPADFHALGESLPSFVGAPWAYTGPDVQAGLDVFDTPGVGDRFVTFPDPGIHVPAGGNVWLRAQLPGAQQCEFNWFLRG